MSFDYQAKPFWSIIDSPELIQYKIRINNGFQDFASLDKYKFIVIDSWECDYPLPPLPEGVIILQFYCHYKFPLNNLPASLEVLYFEYYYDANPDNLANLPSNLYQLVFNFGCFTPLNYLPESLKILHLYQSHNQSSANIPIGLKVLSFSHDTFRNDEMIIYPPGLEVLDLSYYKAHSANDIHDSHSMNEYLEEIRLLEHRLNLENLPITLTTLVLPCINISNLHKVITRLINLEELHIPDCFPQMINTYPPNVKSIFMEYSYDYPLINIPASLTFLQLADCYSKPLDFLRNSNIEHLDLKYNKEISIIKFLPKSLKKLSIIETHTEFYQIKNKYPQLEIDKLPDYDYQEELIDSMRGELW